MIRALLVDPSLFTAPYDAALTEGLRANGVEVQWATRSLRVGEEADLMDGDIGMHFYRLTEGRNRRRGALWKYVKGLEHAANLHRLQREAEAFDIVHFQFAVLPRLDLHAIGRIRKRKPVVLTVHDTTPFNGTEVSALQSHGLDDVFRAVDHLIVLTGLAKENLVGRGIDGQRVTVIGHGPLKLRAVPKVVDEILNPRWRIVLFGRLQHYKGVDVLIEAMALLPEAVRDRLQVIVAGEPLMDASPLLKRAAALGLTAPALEFRLWRLPEQDLVDLLTSADAIVFPYRTIEASGALYLALNYGKWLIASRLGSFTEAIGEQRTRGALVSPGDSAGLAEALAESIGRQPEASSKKLVPHWSDIGASTANLYRTLIAQHHQRDGGKHVSPADKA